jgi:hypothetical protein
MHRRAFFLFILLTIVSCPAARAEAPAQLCARIGTDDTLRPVPTALAPQVNALFQMNLPPRQVATSTVFRCAAGQVEVCTAGANLPCGKASENRTPGSGVTQWCHDHPNADMVPAVATGHDTLFAWACRGTAPLITRQIAHTDTRDFIAEYWKTLP